MKRKSKAAVALGKKGGQSRSAAKQKAARRNGKLGYVRPLRWTRETPKSDGIYWLDAATGTCDMVKLENGLVLFLASRRAIGLEHVVRVLPLWAGPIPLPRS